MAVAIIGSLAGYNYSAEQTRQVGFTFGNEIFKIQEKMEEYQIEFNSKITQWEEGDISKQELIQYAQFHFDRMEELIAQYDLLIPPESFETSVEIFKISAESQLESDIEYTQWIQTDDESHKIRSDALIQEAFEYETAALGEYNRAKLGIEP